MILNAYDPQGRRSSCVEFDFNVVAEESAEESLDEEEEKEEEKEYLEEEEPSSNEVDLGGDRRKPKRRNWFDRCGDCVGVPEDQVRLHDRNLNHSFQHSGLWLR